MGGSYVGNAATFLIETLFGLYILIVMLRFLLQWARADFYNPVSQFIVKATQAPLAPLRRVVPALLGSRRRRGPRPGPPGPPLLRPCHPRHGGGRGPRAGVARFPARPGAGPIITSRPSWV